MAVLYEMPIAHNTIFGSKRTAICVQILTLIHFMFFLKIFFVFLLRCHVSGVFMPCVHRGVHIRIFNLVFILHNFVLYVLQSF